MRLLTFIDNTLNAITMYRLVLYGLTFLAVLSMAMGALGVLPYSGLSLLISFLLLTGVCAAAHMVMAKLFKAPANIDSSFITAFILFFLMLPATDLRSALVLTLTGVLAIVSKYLLAYRHKHLFNPAAAAAVLIGLTGLTAAAWWVATVELLPFVLLLGLLIVRKIRREHLFWSCVAASTIVVLAMTLRDGGDVVPSLLAHFVSWPILFFAAFMVTEPFTTPPTRQQQILYGILIGVLSAVPFHIGRLYGTPELALLIGNIVFFPLTLTRRLSPTLKHKTQIAEDTYEFIFEADPMPKFKAGQYFEWTLPHLAPDTRGIRRYFTIAASPTEPDLRIAVRFGTSVSTFKKHLLALPVGATIGAGPLGGDFVLPADKTEKLVFIAGGIGITPFRSMIRYLLDRQETRDITLFYVNRNSNSIAYRDLWKDGEQIGLKTVFVISEAEEGWTGELGLITSAMVERYLSDALGRTYYLSGPHAMTESYETMLKGMGVKKGNIYTDYFPGYA